MISLDKTLGDMKEEIGYTGEKKSRVFIPEEDMELFKGCRDYLLPRRSFYESIAKQVDSKDYLFGSVVQDVLHNAIERGNNFSRELPFLVEIYSGERGRILSVEDCGDGFNPSEVIHKMNSGEKYFKYQGRGMKLLSSTDKEVSWNEKGNIIYIMSKDQK